MDDSAVMPTGTTSYLDSSYQYSQYDPFYENNYSATSTYPSGQELLSTNPTYNPTSGHGVVETERRKIIIKGLVKRAASDQLKELLRLRCGFSGGEFTAIDIPQSREGGNRGHATITFVGEDYATRAIAKLHKHKYDGKTLSVDYTSEYVSKNEDRRKSHHHSSRHHREDKERKESFKSSSSSQEKKEKSVKKGVIIIANGSTQTPSGSIKRSR